MTSQMLYESLNPAFEISLLLFVLVQDYPSTLR